MLKPVVICCWPQIIIGSHYFVFWKDTQRNALQGFLPSSAVYWRPECLFSCGILLQFPTGEGSLELWTKHALAGWLAVPSSFLKSVQMGSPALTCCSRGNSRSVESGCMCAAACVHRLGCVLINSFITLFLRMFLSLVDWLLPSLVWVSMAGYIDTGTCKPLEDNEVCSSGAQLLRV